MKFLLFLLILITSCKEVTKKPEVQRQPVVPSNAIPDSVLPGLQKHYVLQIPSKYGIDLLGTYNKTMSEYKADSVEYHEAVAAFFALDFTVLENMLVQYKGDTTHCGWGLSLNPYSSSMEPWYLGFNKAQGAVVLFCSYLDGYVTSDKRIFTSPEKVKSVISRIDIARIQTWLKQYKTKDHWTMKDLAASFCNDLLLMPASESSLL
ncbi:MAG: hypothetical protein EOO05_14590 [Chitinophagaceae bacterium]|nr:MAG: hypothetical protein EOO05_14590 [Chitinophagaceae bacterium]